MRNNIKDVKFELMGDYTVGRWTDDTDVHEVQTKKFFAKELYPYIAHCVDKRKPFEVKYQDVVIMQGMYVNEFDYQTNTPFQMYHVFMLTTGWNKVVWPLNTLSTLADGEIVCTKHAEEVIKEAITHGIN